MDIVLFVLAGILLLVGIVGCFVPFIPGPPLCYVGLLLVHFTSQVQFTSNFLLIWACVVIITVLLEYLIPIWGTKQFGGTSAGRWGAAIGLAFGIILIPPLGGLGGIVLGAFIGELIKSSGEVGPAIKSAFGAIVGFLLSIFLQVTVCLVMSFYILKEIVVAFGH